MNTQDLEQLNEQAERYGIILYTPEQVAEILHVTVQTLARWRWQKKEPKAIKCGSKVLYPRKSIVDFINNQMKEVK